IRLVAMLGGYVNRSRANRDGASVSQGGSSSGGCVDQANRPDPPGVETLWKGLQRLRDLAWVWETFGPAAPS
ncbi:MAG: hypothetical protein FWD31_01895, partial [Planctomycetaceae bacterium]|nr:hypothetical protein [Planctomycetaceae bacterium]